MSYITGDPNHFIPRFNFCRRIMAKQFPRSLLTSSAFREEPDEVDDAIKVFLRLKPSSTHDNDNAFEIIDSRTIIYKTPAELAQHKRKLNAPTQTKYVFSKIFSEGASQSEVYTGCVAPLVREVFAGNHCLLFTYGTTNAGKTFTVLGNGENPGVIPRTLTTIFKSIKGKEYGNPKIQPTKFRSVIEVTDSTLQEEMDFKHKLITSVMEKSHDASRSQYKSTASHASTISSQDGDVIDDAVFREMQKNLLKDTSLLELESEPDDRFSVWVSFAEIYNEAIYDLLQPVLAPNARRPQLKLATDERKNTYIKDLKYVYVENEEDAFRVLRFGKSNLQVAATGMNNRSSRSHCIFSIKLLKCPNVKHPTTVDVSSFSICDLAGAERQKKTLNVGQRLKESQNINCSLHVLSRCFNIIRENQSSQEQKMVPFRDSKLTQLFKHALQGKETVTMITNVNSDLNLSEETHHVLKASAIAKCIVVLPRSVKKAPKARMSLFSQMVNRQQRSTLIRWDSCVRPTAPSLSEIDETGLDDISEQDKNEELHLNLLALVEDVREKLKEEKSKHDETRKKLKELQNSLSNNKISNIKRETNDHNIASSRVEDVTNKRKKRKLDMDNDDIMMEKQGPAGFEAAKQEMAHKIKDLEEETRTQEIQIESLTDLVNTLREENKEIKGDLRLEKYKSSMYQADKSKLQDTIKMMGNENDLKAGFVALRNEMEEKLKVRDRLLEEAKEDYLDELCKNQNLEENVDKLEANLVQKRNEITTLKEKLGDLNTDLNIERNYIDTLEEKIEEHEYEIELLKKSNSELNGKLKHMEETNAELESKLKLTEETNLEMESKLKLMQKTNHELESKLKLTEETNLELESKLKLKEETNIELESKLRKMEEINSESESKLIKFQETIAEMENNLTKKVSSITLLEKELDGAQELQKEVDILQQSLKSQIQESSRVSALLFEKTKENKRICEENKATVEELRLKYTNGMTKAKSAIEELKKAKKETEHKLECSENKVIGYQHSALPVLHKELDYYKKLCEDKQASVNNLEQEKESVQANHKEIIAKYEDSLKKSKEECELLKKDSASLRNAFYKSCTTTPKKVLEDQIESLRKQVDHLQIENFKLQEQNKPVTNENKFYNIGVESPGQSPTSEFVKKPKDWRKQKSEGRRRSRSANDGYDLKIEYVNPCKSTLSGKKLHRKTEAGVTLSPGGPHAGSKQRLKLHNSTTYIQEAFDEVQLTIPQASPTNSVKRTLRPRNK